MTQGQLLERHHKSQDSSNSEASSISATTGTVLETYTSRQHRVDASCTPSMHKLSPGQGQTTSRLSDSSAGLPVCATCLPNPSNFVHSHHEIAAKQAQYVCIHATLPAFTQVSTTVMLLANCLLSWHRDGVLQHWRGPAKGCSSLS